MIDSLRVRLGVDGTSDPAAYVVLVLDDAELSRIWAEREQVRVLVMDAVRAVVGDEPWPYASCQAVSEQPMGSAAAVG